MAESYLPLESLSDRASSLVSVEKTLERDWTASHIGELVTTVVGGSLNFGHSRNPLPAGDDVLDGMDVSLLQAGGLPGIPVLDPPHGTSQKFPVSGNHDIPLDTLLFRHRQNLLVVNLARGQRKTTKNFYITK